MNSILVRLVLAVAGVALVAACGSGSSTDGAAVLEWNEIAQRAAAIDHHYVTQSEDPRSAGWQFGPTRTSRVFAMVHLAIADAVAATSGAFAPYYATAPAPPHTDADAAVAQAARYPRRAVSATGRRLRRRPRRRARAGAMTRRHHPRDRPRPRYGGSGAEGAVTARWPAR